MNIILIAMIYWQVYIFLNPHTNPLRHTVTTANTTYVITISTLQMREQKGREENNCAKCSIMSGGTGI